MLAPLLTIVATAMQPAPAPAQTPPPPAAQTAESAPSLLAQRIAAVRRQLTVAPTLVIVPDEASFLAAVARWKGAAGKPRALFPILIDDGSMTARQDIARFARAFKPTTTVRFSAKGEAPTAATLTGSLCASWGAADEPAYLAALAARPQAPGPLGVVATHAATPCRCAAVALASAYGQALVLTADPASENGPFSMAAADKLSASITDRLKELKLEHKTLGDQIDTVTICLNAPANVVVGAKDAPPNAIPQLVAQPNESLALTDLIGRATFGLRVDRWAWASQVSGSAPKSTYAAMCAIFLQPTSAVAFNGYDRVGEFGSFNPAEGLKALQSAGLTTGLLDRPDQSAESWRAWASGSFTADARWVRAAGAQPKGGALANDLFLVNTMGNEDFFQLQPGLCYAGDVPFLELPAAVNFTHSFSLKFSNNPTTVGGRWLDRGAYCYVGSVHEPFLSAFTTQNNFAERLTRGWPIAIAARIQPTDKFTIPGAPPAHPFSAPWRIAVLGDALWTLGPALARTADAPALEGATDPGAKLTEEAKAGRFADVLDTLCMLRRDTDAARWAKALSAEPEKLSADTAARCVLIAYRAGDLDTLLRAARKIDPKAQDPTVADAIWHAVWPQLGNATEEQARAMVANIRPYSYVWDSTTAAIALRRTSGVDVARTFFNEQVAKAPNDFVKKRLEESRSTVFR